MDPQKWSDSFDYVDLDRIPSEDICMVCHEPVVDWYEAPCDHGACKQCWERYLASKNGCATCPFLCPGSLTMSSLTPNKQLNKRLDNLRVYCSYKNQNCEWVGARSDMVKHHHLDCPVADIECPLSGCKTTAPRRNMKEHLEMCPFGNTTCPNSLCPWEGRKMDVNTHLASSCNFHRCHNPDCNLYFNLRLLDQHFDNDCLFSPTDCSAGCGEKMLRKDIVSHLENSCPKTLERRELEKRQSMIESRCKSTFIMPTEVVCMYVSGKKFCTSKATLLRYPDSLFPSLLQYLTKGEGSKSYVYVDRNPTPFGHVLEWLRSGFIPIDLHPSELELLRHEAQHWLLPALECRVKGPRLSQSSLKSTLLAGGIISLQHAILEQLSFDHLTLERTINLSGSSLVGSSFASTEIHCTLSRCDLTGCDLSTSKLSGIDLSDSILKGATLPDDLKDCNLTGCDLTGCDLSRSNLGDAVDLSGAILKETKLPAKLQVISVRGCDLTGVDLSKWNLVDLSGAILKGAILPDDLMECSLCECDLTGCDLSQSTLKGANLSRAILKGVKLPVNLERVNLSGCDLTGFDLSKWNLVDLSRAILKGAILPDDLMECSLCECDLTGFDLSQSTLKGANLSSAILKGVKLPVNLEGVTLWECDLTGFDLSKSTLKGARLSRSILEGVKLPVNLERVNLSGCDLTGFDLSQSTLKGANLSSAILKGAKLPVNLERVNLSGCDLTGFDLSQSTLKGAYLSMAILEGAKLPVNLNLSPFGNVI